MKHTSSMLLSRQSRSLHTILQAALNSFQSLVQLAKNEATSSMLLSRQSHSLHSTLPNPVEVKAAVLFVVCNWLQLQMKHSLHSILQHGWKAHDLSS
jgi:hypothetical protein